MEDILQSYIKALNWGDLLTKGMRAAFVLVLAWIVLAVVMAALRRFEKELREKEKPDASVPSEDSKRADTLTRLLRQGARIVVWTVAVLIFLSELGVDIGPILASAGILGLAIGFGAQNLVRDVISGFFIVLEDQVRVGDVAKVNGTGGLVEGINLRTLVLRDLTGTVHVFPNGTVNTLSNLTKEWSAYVFDIGVAYKEDTDRVVDIMKQVADEMRGDEHFGPLIIEDIEIFGVDNYGDSAVIIKGRIKTRPIKQWEVGRQFLRRLKKAFDEQGIEIPFPHRSIYFGEASKPFIAELAGDQSGPATAGKAAGG